MCANHAQLIKKSRHRFERPLFALAAILTVSIWLIVIALSFAKEETAAIIRQDIVSEYRASHPDSAALDDAAVLKKIPAEDRELLDTIEGLNPLLILLAPLGFVLFLIYTNGLLR